MKNLAGMLSISALCLGIVHPAQALETSPNMVTASASGRSVLSVDAQGRAWAWGDNTYGQLCLGSTGYETVPRQINLSNVKAVAAAGTYNLLLSNSGQVWRCGIADFSNPSTSNISKTPVLVSGLSGIQALAVSTQAAFALDSQGQVWSWGLDSEEILGNGSLPSSMQPSKLNISNVVAIDASYSYALALKQDGSVWGWGLLTQLDNQQASSSTPVDLGLSNIKSIAAGFNAAAAVTQAGQVLVWGDYAKTLIGYEATDAAYYSSDNHLRTPTPVANLSNIEQVRFGGSTGSQSLFAIDSNKKLWTWGENFYGYLGLGYASSSVFTPTKVALDNVTDISPSDYIGLAITNNSQIWVWGSNTRAQFANGQNLQPSEQSTPIKVLMTHGDLSAYQLYMPMGELFGLGSGTYSSDFVPLLNTTEETISVAVALRFTDGTSYEYSLTVPPKTRSGTTVSGPVLSYFTGKTEQPYSIVLGSDGPLDASYVHYEGGKALGENFTDTLSTVWTVSERADDTTPTDHIYVYNPNEQATQLQVQFSGSGVTKSQVSWTIPAKQPLRIDVEDYFSGNQGQTFAAMLVATKPVVATLAHYETNLGTLRLLQPNLGNNIGYNAEGWAAGAGFEKLNFYNPNDFEVTPQVLINYNAGDQATFTLPLLGAHQSFSYPLSDNVRPNEGYSITYRATNNSNQAVDLAASFTHADNQGLNGTPFITTPKNRWAFAEGFRHKIPENVREYLLMYNPSAQDAHISINLFYDDSRTPTTITMTIPAGKKDGIALHEHPQVEVRNVEGSDGIWYGSEVVSDVPIVTYFTHYDIKFGGSFAF